VELNLKFISLFQAMILPGLHDNTTMNYLYNSNTVSQKFKDTILHGVMGTGLEDEHLLYSRHFNNKYFS
jgi:hypothetical protein